MSIADLVNLTTLRRDLTLAEDLRLMPYRCPAGKLSIGVGRNLEDKGIRNDEAELMLSNDIAEAASLLDAFWQDWQTHPEPVRRALLELMFNMGPGTFGQFKRFRAALTTRHYSEAGEHLRDSLWYRQVGETRGGRIVAQIKAGSNGG